MRAKRKGSINDAKDKETNGSKGRKRKNSTSRWEGGTEIPKEEANGAEGPKQQQSTKGTKE